MRAFVAELRVRVRRNAGLKAALESGHPPRALMHFLEREEVFLELVDDDYLHIRGPVTRPMLEAISRYSDDLRYLLEQGGRHAS